MEDSSQYTCPVPDYYGMAAFRQCPEPCDCTYNLVKIFSKKKKYLSNIFRFVYFS